MILRVGSSYPSNPVLTLSYLQQRNWEISQTVFFYLFVSSGYYIQYIKYKYIFLEEEITRFISVALKAK